VITHEAGLNIDIFMSVKGFKKYILLIDKIC